MKGRDLPSYIHRRKRDGVLLFRKKTAGRITEIRLETQFPEGEPVPFALHQERERLLNQKTPVKPGRDIAFAIRRYQAGDKYRRLAPRTQMDYDKRLEFFKDRMGAIQPRDVERRHVIDWQEQWVKATSPHEANYRLRVLRLLFERCIDYGLIERNPVKGVSEVKYEKKEREPWPQLLVARFRKEHAFGTLERTVFELCLGSGQRIGDVLKLTWGQIEDDGISLKQQKTGKRLWVPMTDNLRQALANWPRTDLRIVRMTYRHVAQHMKRAREAVGADSYDNHSLRYTAACELLIAGCDDDTIAAITGQSLEMVRHYTRHVRQKARAERTRGLR